ncbi:MAG: cyanophycinase [Verrucomicrobia bacterium]|nr:cyanophycinase [Verrucomicrobiota bacterium]
MSSPAATRMKTLRTLLGCLACWSAVALASAATPQVATRVGPPEGKLLVVGGGNMTQLWSVFLELAGGKDAPIVVIPTATENVEATDKAVAALRALGATHVTQLHTRDRKLADTEEFTAPLRTARAVWLTGGRQWRLVDAYLGTRTHREILAVLARGGVVGGSSAGASIQASYLVRGAPEGNKIMMAPGHEQGFALLRDTAIDQHVNTRERADDLRPVLKKHPALLGIALDEATAIVVNGDECTVAGAGRARFFANPGSPPVELTAGARYDLAARSALP